MKTLEEIAKNYESNTIDGRDLTRLAQFIPFNMLPEFGLKPTEDYNNIIQLKHLVEKLNKIYGN